VRPRVLRALAVVLASSVTVRLIGLAKNVLAASYFGTSGDMDAYLLALLLPEIAMQLAGTGAFNFIPVFVGERERSEGRAWGAASRMLGYWLLLLLAALAVMLVVCPSLMGWIAPGLSPERHTQTVALSRLLLSMAAAVGLARLLAVILNAEQRFTAAALAEAAFQVVSTLYLIAFHSRGIEALAWSQIAGGFAQLAVVAVGLVGRRQRLSVRLDLKSPPVRRTLRLSWPVYLGAFGDKVNLMVSRGFASLLAPGAISALQYAQMLSETLPTVLAGALTTSLFPFLSQQFARQDGAEARESLRRGMVTVSLVFLPLSAGLWLFARVLVWTVFEHGHFDAASTDLTVTALRIFAPATFALALGAFIGSAYHAHGDTVTPAKAGFVRVATNIGLCLLMVPWLGYEGVALATTGALFVKLVALLLGLRRLLGSRELRTTLATMARVMLAVAVMVGVMQPLLGGAQRVSLPLWAALLALLLLAGLGALVYGLGLFVFCRQELRRQWRLLWGALGHGPEMASQGAR
jgi:putative peptidoglycan lipid II flippase